MNRTASEKDEIQATLKKGVSPGAKKTLQQSFEHGSVLLSPSQGCILFPKIEFFINHYLEH